MNLRLGRFGLQESACAVGLSALISGVFAVNVSDTFARGNVCYAATAAGTLLGLLLLRLLYGAMRRLGAEDLSELLLNAFGPVLGVALAAPLILGLVLAAALPLFRFTLAMERYIFVEADYVPIVLYLLPVVLLLVLSGMECVARMAKHLLLPGALALGTTLLLAAREITGDPQAIVLLSCPRKDQRMLVFARGAEADADMAALLRQSGARGGGKPDMAQGSAPDGSAMEEALRLLEDELST